MGDFSSLGGMGLQMAGAMTKASAARAEGRNAQAWGKYEADIHEQNAAAEKAAAQRKAFERRTEAQRVLGTQQALGAASGAGTGAAAPSLVDLMEKTAGRGEYQAGLETYEGDNRARGEQNAAKAALFRGAMGAQRAKNASTAAMIEGLGGIAKGGYRYSRAGGGYGNDYGGSYGGDDYGYDEPYFSYEYDFGRGL